MASRNPNKRKRPIPRIEDKTVLGQFPINVPKHEPYNVCLANLLKITLPLISWLMGNNENYQPKDIKDAIDFLFERDHQIFMKLLSGEIEVEKFGPIFFPMVFFSSTPDVLDPDDFQRRRIQVQRNSTGTLTWIFSKFADILKWTSINGNPAPRDYVASGQLQGDVAERKVYRALQDYFDKTKDACLVIHSHSFLYNQNFEEKDFIVLNLTKGYVMVIEVKASNNGFPKAKQQLKDGKERVQAVFNSVNGMSNDWQYVGVCYIDKGDSNSTHDFVINGIYKLDFQSIESKVAENRTQVWLPNQHISEFVSVAKVLLFQTQGHPLAPLTKQKQIKKIDQALDLASAPENIFFWTPEQLSIVQAMDVDWMFLMGYYGCGKTILLIERAEYLLQNPSNVVHFYIDKIKSGLDEVLKLRFAGKSIQIKTKHEMFESNSDLSSDEVNSTDHVIIDEASMRNSERFLQQLKKFRSQVSTLWVALGNVYSHTNFNESDFRKDLEDIQFSCPTLKYCLRNGQKIVELAKKERNEFGLSCFADQVEVRSKSNVNDGLLHEMPLIYPNPCKALQEAFKVHHFEKTFISMPTNEDELEVSTLKLAIPGHDFVNFKNKEKLKNWLKSRKMNQHLVLADSSGIIFNTQVSGMEFQSMIYLSPICLKCGDEHRNSDAITRAKVSLLLVRYEHQNCVYCMYTSYPNLKWNKEFKKWEIKQGLTMDQLPKRSREILRKTSKFQLFKK